MATREKIEAQLLGPGGYFEIVEDDVLGVRMPVFKNRKRSLRELLEASALHGDKEYVVHGDRRVTYADHVGLTASVARAFAEQFGVKKGDRVAILAANTAEWVVAAWATLASGGIVSSMNGWWVADEIRHAVELTEPKLIIGDRKRLQRLDGLDLGVPVVEMETDFRKLEGYAPDADLPDVPIAEDDPAVILFTSGTTGRPKGAVSSHRGIVGFVDSAMSHGIRGMLLAASENPVVPSADAPPACALMTNPLFHLSGFYSGIVMTLVTGGKMVFRAGGRFDPEEVLQIIENERVTMWTALGDTAYRVAHHPKLDEYDRSSVQTVGSGGAPTSPELQRLIRDTFPNAKGSISLGYGLSESVASVASTGGAQLQEHPTTVGWNLPSIRLEIRDEHGRALPEGETGEVYIWSAYTMLEYWRNPEATAEVIKEDRWLATGDMGRIEDGRLYIDSRARDLILRGAENIYPIEIENRLVEHPSVADAAVVGVDHPALGQEVKAFVVPQAGAEIDTEALAAFVGESLAPYKVPAHWEVRREALPRNPAGKLMKQVLTGEVADRDASAAD